MTSSKLPLTTLGHRAEGYVPIEGKNVFWDCTVFYFAEKWQNPRHSISGSTVILGRCILKAGIKEHAV
jgi:hypothetical protein